MKGKTIENIEPFNKFWYKDCFYSMFFPLIISLDKPIYPFLFNDNYFYAIEEGVFYLKCNEKKTRSKILEEIDVKEFGINKVPNIKESIINSIDNNKPVILFIDCFYEPIRPDTFKIQHTAHYLLVYGYDTDKLEFNIIEHQYRESMNFEKRKIAMSDLENCYMGALDNLVENNERITYFEYSIIKRTPKINGNENIKNMWLKNYINSFYETEKSIVYGIESLKQYILDQEFVFLNENLFREKIHPNLELYLNSLNDIIHSKKIERERALLLCNTNNISKTLDEIINMWSIIRGLLWKYKLTNNYIDKNFEVLIDKFKEIIHKERKYIKELNNFFIKEKELLDGEEILVDKSSRLI